MHIKKPYLRMTEQGSGHCPSQQIVSTIRNSIGSLVPSPMVSVRFIFAGTLYKTKHMLRRTMQEELSIFTTREDAMTSRGLSDEGIGKKENYLKLGVITSFVN